MKPVNIFNSEMDHFSDITFSNIKKPSKFKYIYFLDLIITTADTTQLTELQKKLYQKKLFKINYN